ncbi:Fc receptor-like protein 5 isoform X1 [Thunnus albacares]|uniref:Fc receptor-like protein 5 isoform X1 n=1 Tax=Thunnus albacares TaxID=8236 RepID=UPI001CF6851F|nr:Fc receptor-like protein 5 isoform X1 [Thunnus albacares]
MQLTPFCLMMFSLSFIPSSSIPAAYLQVSPDRSQFFRYNTVSLSCEDQLNSTGWKVKRKTLDGGVRTCSSGWGFTSSGSICIIRNIYPTDTGVYWCESPDGEQSSSVNITTTDRTVILESPAMPVSEGAAVILGCKDESSPNPKFIFYKDGRPIGKSSTGEMTIQHVSKTDEGLYMCSSSSGVESIGSWLAVEASLPPSSPAPDAASCSVSVSRLVCHLGVGIPYLLSTILLGLMYRDRNRAAARPEPDRRGSNDIIMEIVV